MRTVQLVVGLLGVVLAQSVFLNAFAVTSLDDIQAGNIIPATVQPIVGPSNTIPAEHWSYKLIQKMQQDKLGQTTVQADGSKPMSRTEMAVALSDLSATISPEQLKQSLNEREQTQFDILKEEFQSEMKVLQARIEKLEGSVEVLSGKVDQKILEDAQAKKEASAIKYPNAKWTGLVHAWGSMTEDSLPDKNFRLRRVNIGVTGDVAKNWKYRVILNTERSSNNLLDAYADYTGIPNHVVRIGQFIPGYSYDAVRGFGKSPFIELSQIGLKGVEREKGAAIYGSLKKLVDYQAGIYNGNGPNNDTNNDIGYGGRVTVKPFTYLMDEKKWGRVELGGSLFKGNTGTDGHTDSRNRYGLEARYIHKKFEIGTEWLRFREPERQDGQGYYVEAAYKLTPKWQLVGRYDCLDPDRSISRNSSIQYTGGVNYFISEYNMRLALNYMYYHDQTGVVSGNALRFMVQHMF